jgi:hypothetical protein
MSSIDIILTIMALAVLNIGGILLIIYLVKKFPYDDCDGDAVL